MAGILIAMKMAVNKKKIINDPVYGFITIPSEIVYDLIEHPYFQRLRYIKQVSMTHLVYPGALHTRFHHALGAMHLMGLAIETLRGKGVEITPQEEEAATIAILLHDVGHGPFSHSLEHTLVEEVSHERISLLIMNKLNGEFHGQLTLAIKIFKNQYTKHFLHQLVSSQLDTDRMDYLNRDSFFTGVSEGVISFDRIIKMLHVSNNQLVVEQKGIYSIEKFLIARRLMYWQVYLHKTVVSAEQMLIQALRRAKELTLQGHSLYASPSLQHFLKNHISQDAFEGSPNHLYHFSRLDDTDILSSLKEWCHAPDFALSYLCKGLMNRNLNRVEMSDTPPEKAYIQSLLEKAMEKFGIPMNEAEYLIYSKSIFNNAYEPGQENIKILMKNGSLQDITQASDLSNLEALSKQVTKYIVSYPKEL